MSKPSIVCFGEVLWDSLPNGRIAGGAPMNVGFHANQLGLKAELISRVGRDELGDELIEFLDKIGFSTELIQTDNNVATGVVNVTFQNATSPVYEIVSPAAWDFIQTEELAKEYVRNSDAFIFGSLACRTEVSQDTLFDYVDAANIRVFDVNLRPPFYSQALIEQLLERSEIVKMNDEEMALIAGWEDIVGDEVSQLKRIQQKFEIGTIILTKGKNGAICISESEPFIHPGFPVQVQDTIGSGDSFLAGFLSKYLTGAEIRECLNFASAVGALVASKPGGTPLINEQEIEAFIRSISLEY